MTIEPVSPVEAVAQAWASIDGQLDLFLEEKEHPATRRPSGRFEGYLEDAAELLRRVHRRGYVLTPRLEASDWGLHEGDTLEWIVQDDTIRPDPHFSAPPPPTQSMLCAWQPMASVPLHHQREPRITAHLLPDGRVILLWGDYWREIDRPPSSQ